MHFDRQSSRNEDVRVLQRLLQYQKVILESQRDLLHLENPQSMYEKLVGNIVEATEAIGATVVIQDPKTDLLLIQAPADVDKAEERTGQNGEDARPLPVRAICPTVVARKVFETGRKEGPMDPGQSELTRGVEDARQMFENVRSVMALPVYAGNSRKPDAALVIESGEFRHFTPELIDTLEQLAVSLGLGLNRYRERQELEAAKNEVEILAFHDALTHLPNRRLLEDSLEGAVERAAHNQITLAVCMLDLDGFKPINDTHGHEGGDQLLLETAARIKGCLRQTDFLARLGGDEFVLLLEGIRDEDSLKGILEKIGTAIQSPVRLENGAEVTVSLSAGVCLFPRDQGNNPDVLLRLADQALYASKSNKQNRRHFWTIFGEGLHPTHRAT
ncbi:GGDEF domain-containing protein [Leptospirillum ferriphilum]|uniref:Putative signaling protein n=1 Tax=Leptospirillum ferriphilum (strain ML-04) TaxID=1048260 RepID=J9Z9X3_LEPFM|nr:GGDEF domain-containing protein [Leptospirillum ferriphilum]AFS52971.1 putative signaling protein [Leptospirillum ferriphilum ML-04]